MFDVYEIGGLKSRAMDPAERKYVLDNVKGYLVKKPQDELKKLVESAESIPDQVLLERIRMQYEYRMSESLYNGGRISNRKIIF